MKQRHIKKRIYAKTKLFARPKLKCQRCGMPERHYVTAGGFTHFGFWTCPDLYDPVTKRRKEPDTGDNIEVGLSKT